MKLTHTSFDLGKTGKVRLKASQFRSKAKAIAFTEDCIGRDTVAKTDTLKTLQSKINEYLASRNHLHKSYGSIDILSVNQDVRFNCLCKCDDEVLIAGSNALRTVYSVSLTFDGVGIVGTLNPMLSFADG